MHNLKITNSFADLSSEFYTRLSMEGLKHDVKCLHVNPKVASFLGITPAMYESPEFLAIMSGQQDLPGGKTLAAVYSGHQFGVWAGQLGDGRAHLLGAIETSKSPQPMEIQLKGAGLTPYSRMGDGRAVLRSSIREYLASAAMDGLNIPTTLALSITKSQDRVQRERVETAAVVSRVAPSFVRFGSFQHWYANQQPDLLHELLDYVCDNFYRDELAPSYDSINAKVIAFIDRVCYHTAKLMAMWQSVGFVHGVMNTDNMSILGLTIDYGPYGFMEHFDPHWVINRTDREGRYAFSQQVQIALWNLHQFAFSFSALGLSEEELREALVSYEDYFYEAFYTLQAKKLGVDALTAEDDELFNEFWRLLATQKADLTLSYRYLADIDEDEGPWISLFQDPEAAKKWLVLYRQRLQRDSLSAIERRQLMNSHNPLYIIRGHIAEAAIEAAENDDTARIDFLVQILQSPFERHEGAEAYEQPTAIEKQNIRLSCSS